MSSEHEFGKNFDLAKLSLTADQRGFIVGHSRLGVTKLREVPGGLVDVLGGYTSITCNLVCRVVDGAWIEPEVSSLGLRTRDRAVFEVTDGDELQLSYDSAVIFTGYVSGSALASELVDGEEKFTVQLIARGYEGIKNGQPAIGTVETLWAVKGGTERVIQWAGGKVRTRAADITGRAVLAEDIRADVQLEETLAVETDVTGTQGDLLAELAMRSGVILDQSSGTAVTFRSYQDSPRWVLEDEHVVSGYTLAVDRQSTSAMVVTRKEDEDFVRAFRAGGQRVVATTEISTAFNNEWDMGAPPAYAPLIGRPSAYLASARVPRSDDLELVSRLPILARFRHGGATYEGAVVQLTHTIGKDRWMIDLTCEPGTLVTRESQLNPTPVQHLRCSVAAGTATLTWSDGTLGTAHGTPILPTYFAIDAALATKVAVGDELRVFNAAGVEKEDTVFTVTAISAPAFAAINVTVTPAPAATIVEGDIVRYAHYGPTPVGWVVYYQRNPTFGAVDNKAIGPHTLGEIPLHKTVYSPTAVITGLTNSADYRFTVYALGSEIATRSAPSHWVSTTVTDAEGLELVTSGITTAAVDLDWTWTGVTLTGFKVGRDGVDSTGFGVYETTLDPATLSVTFDKLLGGTTYRVFVAAMVGTVELERVVSTITTDPVVVGPPDPGNPGAVVPLVGFSGLTFNSVCFLPDTTAAGAVAFGALRNRPMDGLLYFPGRATWADLNWHQPDHAAWVQSGHLLITSVPHAPESEGALMNTRGANNDYVTQQRAFGASLVSQGLNVATHIIRVDWECNGDWYYWSIKNGGAGALKLALKNFVINVRAGGATNVKFDLCFNNGPSQAGADFAAFPGAEFIDVVAVDSYDWFNATFTDPDWATKIALVPGLKTCRDFAVANGIQFALDEGGNIHISPGGNDNAFYWQKMFEFFTDPLNTPYIAWHNTYNHPGAPATLLHDFDSNPLSWAYYLTTWGA